MPLPPRDLSALHVALNPALADLHASFPLSRYVPSVGLFKLYKLAFEGSPLLPLLSIPSWMTLACLDDLGADYCIGQAMAVAKSSRWDRSCINAAMATASAPFLVPMMVPIPGQVPAAAIPAPAPAAAIPAPAPAQSSSSDALQALHSSTLRCISALVRDYEDLDFKDFRHVAPRLARLPTAAACKAVLGLGELLDADPDFSSASIRGKLHTSVSQFEPPPPPPARQPAPQRAPLCCPAPAV